LTRFALRHAHLVVVAALIVAILGVASALRMEVDVFPDLHQPAVIVAVPYAGMPAKDMEAAITRRLERMFMQAGGIEHMESRSITGMGIITIYFDSDVDVNAAVSQVISLAIADISRLPPGTLPPLVVRYDVSGLPVCELTLSSDTLSQSELFDVANYTIREQLGNVKGVAAPPVYGGLIRQVMIYTDPDKLQAYGLSPLDVVHAVGRSNLIIPTGVAKIGNLAYDVMSNAEFSTPEAFNAIPVATRGGKVVFVRDIGQAKDANAIVTNIVRVDGKRSVYIPISKQTGANTIKVVDAVRGAVKRFHGIPAGVKLDVVLDQSVYVRNAVKQLGREGVLGAFLAGLCVLLFLVSVRSTGAIVLAIPFSILAALSGLFLLGETVNLMTLGGLALAVGRIIDDAVVVIENTIRHLSEKGSEPAQAAEEATEEVAMPVLASTITTCVVFLPVIYLTGIAKFLFTPLAISVVLAMAASYVFAMMFIPVFCARFLARRPETEEESGRENVLVRGYARFQGWYGRRLEATLRHTRVLSALVLALLAGSAVLVPFTGYEFFPRVDAGTFILHLRAKSGMRVEQLETEVVAKVEELIKKTAPRNEVQRVVSNLGISSDPFATMNSKNSAEHEAFIQVKLVDGHSMRTDELIRRLREQLPTVVPGVGFVFQTGGITSAAINFGRIAPIDVQVIDENIQEGHAAAVIAKAEMEKVPGLADPLINIRLDYPTLHLEVDRWKAALLDLSEEDVVKNIITSLNSSIFIHPIVWIDPESGNDYLVGVQYPEERIDSLETLKNVPMTGKGSRELQTTILRNVAPLRREQTMVQATHWNVLRSVDVFGDVAEGKDLGSVASAVEKRIENAKFPEEAEVHVRGVLVTMREAFTSFFYALGLAIILIYLILVAQFRSLLAPLIVMSVIPVTAIGVFTAVLATRTTYNIETLLGVLMLVGIVVSNSVLFVEFADRTHEQGEGVRESAVIAGKTRLRPIVMTALATVFALLPLALGIEKGSEANVPLARAVIGGLLASVPLTLFFLPSLWVAAMERREKRSKRSRPSEQE
jgi:multidrug efflux pump subunit AcrB